MWKADISLLQHEVLYVTGITSWNPERTLLVMVKCAKYFAILDLWTFFFGLVRKLVRGEWRNGLSWCWGESESRPQRLFKAAFIQEKLTKFQDYIAITMLGSNFWGYKKISIAIWKIIIFVLDCVSHLSL